MEEYEDNERNKKLTEYYADWVMKNKQGVVADVTINKYMTTLDWLKKIAPDMKMRELTKSSYQAIITKYGEEHEKTTTMDFHHQVRAALVDAYDEGILKRDISRRVVIKGKAPTVKKRTKYLNKKELCKVLEELNLNTEINWDWFILLIAKTGLRFEEALALTPDDFDFMKLRLSVNKAFDYKDKNTFCKTKNESSMRDILLDWRTAMQFENMIKGMDKNERIFKNLSGKSGRVYNSTANKYLQRLCRKAGVTEITIHALRHTHASILLYEGVSISSISRRLGHASMDVTQRVYLHTIKELETKDDGKIMASMMEIG